MRRGLARFLLVIYYLVFLMGLSLHVATFITSIPLDWILPPILLLIVVGLVQRIARIQTGFGVTFSGEGFISTGLLLYAVLMFVYAYRSTGGASDFVEQNGAYFAAAKNRALTRITLEEYRTFPNLWMRALSAWILALAWMAQRELS